MYQPNPRASEGAIDADILGMEARQAEQDRDNALRRPRVDRADGSAGHWARRALMLLGLIAAVVAIWLAVGNTAAMIGGTVAAAATLLLAVRWWKQRTAEQP